ncbi:MAG: 50S ribosomal protein L24e [Candidatus Undinarchaeales archaeon]
METCSFCGTVIEQGTGKTVVKKDGSLLHFCSGKCEKNMLKLGRNPIKVKWTKKYRKFRGKDVEETVSKLAEEEKKEEKQKKKLKKSKSKKSKKSGKKSKKKKKPAEKKKEKEKPAKDSLSASPKGGQSSSTRHGKEKKKEGK